MESIRTVPNEILNIIPKFDGDEKLLNLFLRKCEYVIRAFRSEPSTIAQDTYLFHAVTSRLRGKASHLISEREDIDTWTDLKIVLIQHFGDPRSEECIAIELENLKINNGESYLNFCNRIQSIRSTLFAKLNLINDENVKKAKMNIYDHLSLNVFLYNLSEDMIRVVRLHQCKKLEDALTIVMEEVNFYNQYKSRSINRQKFSSSQPMSSTSQYNKFSNQTQIAKPFVPSVPQFKFGIPNQGNYRVNSGLKFGNQQNFRPPISQNNNFKFGIPQQGYRHGPQNNFQPQFKFGIPQQGYRHAPQNNFQSQFKFGIPHNNQQKPIHKYENDISMRTAPQGKPNSNPANNNLYYTDIDYDNYYYPENDDDCYEPQYNIDEENEELKPEFSVDSPDAEDFQQTASKIDQTR